MTMVSPERVWESVSREIYTLSRMEHKQDLLLRLAEASGFSINDVNKALNGIISIGGATQGGEQWPLGWNQAKGFLTETQIAAVETQYLEVIKNLPDSVKQAHPKLFK